MAWSWPAMPIRLIWCNPPPGPRRSTWSTAPILSASSSRFPEHDAQYVYTGTKASLLVPAFRALPIPGAVTRTSWALMVKTARSAAEIDLPNPNSQLLPGMRADVELTSSVPEFGRCRSGRSSGTAIRRLCWMCENGRAVRTEIDTGTHDGEWIEVMNRPAIATGPRATAWTPINGSEQVIVGDRSHLADGGAVKVTVLPSEAQIANAAQGTHSVHCAGGAGLGRPASRSAPHRPEAGRGDHRDPNGAPATLAQLKVELAVEAVKVAEASITAAESRGKEARLNMAKRRRRSSAGTRRSRGSGVKSNGARSTHKC